MVWAFLFVVCFLGFSPLRAKVFNQVNLLSKLSDKLLKAYENRTTSKKDVFEAYMVKVDEFSN